MKQSSEDRDLTDQQDQHSDNRYRGNQGHSQVFISDKLRMQGAIKGNGKSGQQKRQRTDQPRDALV